MHVFVLTSLALALVLAVVALIHQVRLRRALEKLLRLIFHKWRQHDEEQDRGRRDGAGRRNDRL